MFDVRNSTHALLSDAAKQSQVQHDVARAKKALRAMREVDNEVKQDRAVLFFRKKREEEEEHGDVAHMRKEAGMRQARNNDRFFCL